MSLRLEVMYRCQIKVTEEDGVRDILNQKLSEHLSGSAVKESKRFLSAIMVAFLERSREYRTLE